MAGTFVCIRHLQQVPTLPVTVTPPSVGYIDIDVLLIQVQIALLGVIVYPRGAVFEVGIRTEIQLHLLLSCHEDVVYADIVIDMETVSIKGEIANICFQKASAEVLWSLFFQPFKPFANVLPRMDFTEPFVRTGFLVT